MWIQNFTTFATSKLYISYNYKYFTNLYIYKSLLIVKSLLIIKSLSIPIYCIVRMAFLKVDPGEMKYVLETCFVIPYDEINIDKVMDIIKRSWQVSIFTAVLYLLAVYGAQRIIKASVFMYLYAIV